VSHPTDGGRRFTPPRVVVAIDASTLVELKKLVRVENQWAIGTHMAVLLNEGALCYPSQVVRELKSAKYPDMPAAWVAGHKGSERYPEPAWASVAEVLAVAQLVDPSSEDDPADPYVVAMAYEIREVHEDACQVVVTTNDYVDRLPAKESIATACDRLAIEWWKLARFVEWLIAETM